MPLLDTRGGPKGIRRPAAGRSHAGLSRQTATSQPTLTLQVKYFLPASSTASSASSQAVPLTGSTAHPLGDMEAAGQERH